MRTLLGLGTQPCYQIPSDFQFQVRNHTSTDINIELVRLSLDSRGQTMQFRIVNYYKLVINYKTLKYWGGIQQGQSYLMGRSWLFSFGWPLFQWWCHNKNIFWGRCFVTSTSLAPHFFLLGWLKLNLMLFLDQLKLAHGDEQCWQL